MLKEALEEFLYWLISFFVNLLIFSLLTTVFIVKVQEVPEIYPLKVEIKELRVEKPKKVKSVVEAQSEAKRTVAKSKAHGESGKKSAGTTLTQAHEKGDIQVPIQEEEDVSLLAELQKKIESRLKERKEPVKKRVGKLSAVVTGKRVSIKGGSRKIVYIPPAPDLITSEFPSAVRVRIWVSPEGKVLKALLLQRSGNVNIDNTLLAYVREIRFESVQEREVQVGEITFSFKGG